MKFAERNPRLWAALEKISSLVLGSLAFWLLLIPVVIVILPFWRIFQKAGYSGFLSLLMLVPVVNLVMLYFLAFSDWPATRGR